MHTHAPLPSRSLHRNPVGVDFSRYGTGSFITVRVELPIFWTEALQNTQQQLRRGLGPMLCTAPEHFHLSLTSVLAATSRQVDRIVEAVERAVRDCDPVHLYLATPDIFSPPRSQTYIYAGVRGEIEGLYQLRQALRLIGLPVQGNQFTPHITLGRLPVGSSPAVVSRLRCNVARAVIPATEPFIVTRISLLHHIQELGDVRVRYERLPSVPIGGVPVGC